MLAHDLIRDDLEIIDLLHNKTYTSNEINNYTRYLKHSIYEKLNGDTLNKIIFIILFFYIISCMVNLKKGMKLENQKYSVLR